MPAKLLAKVSTAAARYSIDIIETEHYGSNMAGTATGFDRYPERFIGDAQKTFRIKLNARHNAPTKFATLAHELGDIYCGHLGADAKGRWPNRRTLFHSANSMELEAEAVSWLVCERNGIATRSTDYLNSLIDQQSLEGVSIYAIYEAANRVESRTTPAATN